MQNGAAVSDSLLFKIFKSSVELLCLASYDGYFKTLNPAWTRALGWTKKELLASPWSRFVHPDDLESTSVVSDKLVNGNEVIHFENRYLCKDGSYRWLSWNSTSFADEALIFGIARDITERKKSEQLLKDSEEYLKSILRAIPDPFFIIDKSGQFLDFKATHDQLYLEPQVFMGKNVADVLPEDVSVQILSSIKMALSTNELVQMEYSLDVNGSNRNYHARFVAFGRDKVICVVTDITDSVVNINKIKQLLVTQEATTSRLQNFTHIVSHNLRSHTSNFQALFSLIEDEYPHLLDNEYISLLKNSADNLSDSIKHLTQVLDVNETNNKVWELVNLSNCIDTNALNIMQLAKSSGVDIINNVEDDIFVYVIHAYLDSIVLNLMTNAIKYNSPDRDSFLKISCTRAGENYILEFMDNGLGIDLKKYGQKIFGMYKTFHGHPDSKGLGLFMTKTQLEAMGGSIEVESEPGVGTTFRLTLPVSGV